MRGLFVSLFLTIHNLQYTLPSFYTFHLFLFLRISPMKTTNLNKPTKFSIAAAGTFIVSMVMVSIFFGVGLFGAISSVGWLFFMAIAVGASIIQFSYDEECQLDYSIWFCLFIVQAVIAFFGFLGLIGVLKNHLSIVTYGWYWGGVFCLVTFVYMSLIWTYRWVMTDNMSD